MRAILYQNLFSNYLCIFESLKEAIDMSAKPFQLSIPDFTSERINQKSHNLTLWIPHPTPDIWRTFKIDRQTITSWGS